MNKIARAMRIALVLALIANAFAPLNAAVADDPLITVCSAHGAQTVRWSDIGGETPPSDDWNGECERCIAGVFGLPEPASVNAVVVARWTLAPYVEPTGVAAAAIDRRNPPARGPPLSRSAA